METLLGFVVMLSLPGYWVLQATLAKRYAGGWRIAALAPLVVMLPLLLYTVFAFLQGSNLWPLLMIFASPVAFVYLALVSAIRAIA